MLSVFSHLLFFIEKFMALMATSERADILEFLSLKHYDEYRALKFKYPTILWNPVDVFIYFIVISLIAWTYFVNNFRNFNTILSSEYVQFNFSFITILVCQKVCSDFAIISYRKIRMKFLTNPNNISKHMKHFFFLFWPLW